MTMEFIIQAVSEHALSNIIRHGPKQGSETSGRNRFLQGRSGKNGRHWKKGISSSFFWKKLEKNWKKLEEINVGLINSACKQSVGKKFPDNVK